jgi:hypothetical protein
MQDDSEPRELDFDPDKALKDLESLRQAGSIKRRREAKVTTLEGVCDRCGVSLAYHGVPDEDGNRNTMCLEAERRFGQ